MYSDFMSWIVKTMAGIGFDSSEPGTGRFIIAPRYFKEVDHVKCSYKTHYGDICLSWHRKDGRIILKINIDEGVRAVYNGDPLSKGISIFNIKEEI